MHRIRAAAVLATAGLLTGAGLVPAAQATAPKPGQTVGARTYFGTPFATATDASGDVYVAVMSRVLEVSPHGRLTLVAGTGNGGTAKPGKATSSPLGAIGAITVDAAGDLYIAEATRIDEVTPDGRLRIVRSGVGFDAIVGLAVDAAGDLYLADADKSEVEELSPTGDLTRIAGTGVADAARPGPATQSPLDTPAGVGLDAAGDVYIADAGNFEIERVDASTGMLSIIAGRDNKTGAPTPGPATATKLGDMDGLAVDAAGDVYAPMVEDEGELDDGSDYGVVAKVDTAGTLSIVAGSMDPVGIPQVVVSGSATRYPIWAGAPSVDQAGDLYLPDTFDSVVQRVAPSGRMTLFAGRGRLYDMNDPRIKGTYAVGSTLLATHGTWLATGVRLRYRWYAAGHRIAGATGSRLRLTRAMRGRRISLAVTASKPGYSALVTKARGRTVEP